MFPVSVAYKAGGKTDKRPLVRWQEQAAASADAVDRLWSSYPQAKCGVVTGNRSGLYVVDVDDPDAYDEQPELAVALSNGAVVPSNRPGGFHWYFGAPEDGEQVRNSQGGGIDFRGDGGMVVCWQTPPEDDLRPLPAEVARWARERTPERTTQSSHDLQVVTWPGGGCDAWVVSMVGSMCRRGFQPAAALAALLAENDAGRFDPPCDAEWLEEKVRGVYERYYTGQTSSPLLLKALAKS